MNKPDGPMSHDRRRAENFGAQAELYDRTRPSYPHDLISWLGESGVGTAVDVGCGTGQVARLLAGSGWQVTGIEIDERMADVARSHGIGVVVSRFEEWQPRGRFDLVCSGQAWHWIDPNVGYGRAAELLRPGGRLALFWNAYRYDEATMVVFETVVTQHAADLLVDSIPFGTASSDHADLDDDMIRRTDEFGTPERLAFSHGRSCTVDQWLAELQTHSGVGLLTAEVRLSLLADLREALMDVHGDEIRVDYETRVTSALRLSS